MNIITLHEAEQRAELRKPLWPTYSTFPHCSGPCNQGRTVCMTPEACQTGQAEEELPPRPPLLRHDPAVMFLAAVASVGAVYLCAMGAMPYVLAFGRWLGGLL